MATKNKRLTISIPPDLEERLNIIKRNRFYNNPQSDMIRHLIKLGLDSENKKPDKLTQARTIK